LAVVGGSKSLDALFARLQSGSGKIPTAVISTLSVLKDSAIDTHMQTIASNPEHPQYLAAYDVISKRNNPGCVDYFNKLFAERSPVGKELTALLRALESLGNVKSVEHLLTRLAAERDSAVVRTLQVAVKRVVLRIEQPDRVWQEAYAPIFRASPNAELQLRFLPLLDVVSTPEAFAICLDRLAGTDEALARAADQALQRWRNIDVCDHWLTVINDPAKTEAARDQALRYIDLALRSDAVAETWRVAVKKAVNLFLASENKNLRAKLIQWMEGMDDYRRGVFYKALKPHLARLPDHREQLDALIKKNPE
jgi:hypothetical protein